MDFRFVFNKLLLVIAGIATGIGLGVGVFQAYFWISRGVLLNISVLDAFIYVDENLISMGQLPGVGFRLLEQVPLAFLLIMIGLVLLLLARFVAQIQKY